MKPLKRAGISMIYKEDKIPSIFIALDKDQLKMKYINFYHKFLEFTQKDNNSFIDFSDTPTSNDVGSEITEYNSLEISTLQTLLSRNTEVTQDKKKERATCRIQDASVTPSDTQNTPFNTPHTLLYKLLSGEEISNTPNTLNIPNSITTQAHQAKYILITNYNDVNHLGMNNSQLLTNSLRNDSNTAYIMPFTTNSCWKPSRRDTTNQINLPLPTLFTKCSPIWCHFERAANFLHQKHVVAFEKMVFPSSSNYTQPNFKTWSSSVSLYFSNSWCLSLKQHEYLQIALRYTFISYYPLSYFMDLWWLHQYVSWYQSISFFFW